MKLYPAVPTRLSMSMCFVAVFLMLSVCVVQIFARDETLEELHRESQVTAESVEKQSLYQDRGLDIAKLLQAMEER